MCGCDKLTDVAFAGLLAGDAAEGPSFVRGLTKLDASGCPLVGDGLVRALARHAPRLAHLSLRLEPGPGAPSLFDCADVLGRR